MALKESDTQKIAEMLKKKTGVEWTSDANGVYCDVILNASDRFEGERIFLDLFKQNGMSAPDGLDSSLRGMEEGQAQIFARFTSNTTLLELLEAASGTPEQEKRTNLEKENAQIAALLKEKTGFNWTSNADGVSCTAILDAHDRAEGESKFLQFLKKNGVPAPDIVDSSLRGMDDGKAEITAEFKANPGLLAFLIAAAPPAAPLTPYEQYLDKRKKDAEISILALNEKIAFFSNQIDVYDEVIEKYEKLLSPSLSPTEIENVEKFINIHKEFKATALDEYNKLIKHREFFEAIITPDQKTKDEQEKLLKLERDGLKAAQTKPIERQKEQELKSKQQEVTNKERIDTFVKKCAAQGLNLDQKKVSVYVKSSSSGMEITDPKLVFGLKIMGLPTNSRGDAITIDHKAVDETLKSIGEHKDVIDKLCQVYEAAHSKFKNEKEQMQFMAKLTWEMSKELSGSTEKISPEQKVQMVERIAKTMGLNLPLSAKDAAAMPPVETKAQSAAAKDTSMAQSPKGLPTDSLMSQFSSHRKSLTTPQKPETLMHFQVTPEQAKKLYMELAKNIKGPKDPGAAILAGHNQMPAFQVSNSKFAGTVHHLVGADKSRMLFNGTNGYIVTINDEQKKSLEKITGPLTLASVKDTMDAAKSKRQSQADFEKAQPQPIHAQKK